MKLLSLFSGIGGFEQAAFKLGWELAAFAEIDKFAIQSYRAIYGEEHLNLGDVSKIPNFLLPPHDVLVGGFPCQAFSVAGERAGMAFECPECSFRTTLDFTRYANRDFSCTLCGHDMEAVDGRGLLFFEVARVAKFMQPKAIVLENVKGLVGHDKGRTLDTIVTTLSSIGYVVDFEILNSKFFGVPQSRERIFIVAIREDLKSLEPWTEESLKGSTVIPKGKRRLKEYEEVKTFNFPYPENDAVTSSLRDILENEADNRHYLDPEEFKGFLTFSKDTVRVTEATKKGFSEASFWDSINIAHPKSKTRRGRVGRQIANTIMAAGVEQAVVVNRGRGAEARKLTPRECWRLQAFPDSAFDKAQAAGVSNPQLYKQAGNAVTVTTVHALLERLDNLLKTL